MSLFECASSAGVFEASTSLTEQGGRLSLSEQKMILLSCCPSLAIAPALYEGSDAQYPAVSNSFAHCVLFPSLLFSTSLSADFPFLPHPFFSAPSFFILLHPLTFSPSRPTQQLYCSFTDHTSTSAALFLLLLHLSYSIFLMMVL